MGGAKRSISTAERWLRRGRSLHHTAEKRVKSPRKSVGRVLANPPVAFMLNHRHRCIYVHIPKTAGNSINRIFGVAWENHKDLRRYREEMTAEQFASYFKFAVVRNPWDRLLSDYNYQRKKSRPAETKLGLFTVARDVRVFRDWVTTVLGNPHQFSPESWGGEVSPGLHRWSPQVDWISLERKIAVDRVLRIENLGQSFPTLCAALQLPPQRLPHRNRRLHWHYSWYYDPITRDIVGDYYRRDIETFGYRFESPVERGRMAFYTVFRRCTQLLVAWYSVR